MVKNPPANAGEARDAGSIPGSGRASGVENENLLQYSCLGNPMDREAWWATVHGVSKSWTQPSTHVHSYTHTHTHTHECSITFKIPYHYTGHLYNIGHKFYFNNVLNENNKN